MTETTGSLGGAAAGWAGEAEAALVERAKGEAAAFGELYDRYYPMVVNFAFRWTVDADLAEEIAANTFFKALRAIGTYRREAPFKSWLYRIATNELRSHWRTAKRLRLNRQAYLEQAGRLRFGQEGEDPREAQEKLESFARLRECVEELSEKLRVPVMLRHLEGLDYPEIAHALGKKTATVRSLVYRGLQELARKLGRGGQPPAGGSGGRP